MRALVQILNGTYKRSSSPSLVISAKCAQKGRILTLTPRTIVLGPVPQSIGKPTNENAPQLGLVANERLAPVPQSYFLSFVSSPTRGASLPKRWKRWYNWTADIGKREGRNVNKHHMYSSVG